MRETLRGWLEGTEIYVLEVILEKRKGKLASLVRGFLHAMSKVYGRGIKVRRYLYNILQAFEKRRFSFWKVLLVALVTSALAGIIVAILFPTVRS
jgi:hypothetical protein